MRFHWVDLLAGAAGLARSAYSRAMHSRKASRSRRARPWTAIGRSIVAISPAHATRLFPELRYKCGHPYSPSRVAHWPGKP